MASNAFLVGAGILLSRLSGLVRERVFAHYFGNSDAGDAFKAALKIPNILQNLFGEGVLSASFIPEYAKQIAHGDAREATRLAGVLGTILLLAMALLSVLGVWATPYLIDWIAPGFQGAKRLLTIDIVRILFPGTALLVMSAWCLGILNSHRRFFLSYAAPVIWNFAIIGAMLMFGGVSDLSSLARYTAWGLVLGSGLQLLVQLPATLRLVQNLRPSLDLKVQGVRSVLRNFVPVVISRGVVQISAYIDNMIASLLPTGAVSSLAYAQTLYLLPVSLFGMSVSASELPLLSQASGSDEEVSDFLITRINRGLERIAFFVVPSAAAFILLGDFIVGALFQTGQFGARDTNAVWYVLMGASIGLLATTQSRLYSSAFYSLKDTKTPLRFALVRVTFGVAIGLLLALKMPQWLGIAPIWGTVGLTVAASIASWVEFVLLRRRFNHRVGLTGMRRNYQLRVWLAALLSCGAAALVMRYVPLPALHVIIRALIAAAIAGSLYLGLGLALRLEPAQELLGKVTRRLRRR